VHFIVSVYFIDLVITLFRHCSGDHDLRGGGRWWEWGRLSARGHRLISRHSKQQPATGS